MVLLVGNTTQIPGVLSGNCSLIFLKAASRWGNFLDSFFLTVTIASLMTTYLFNASLHSKVNDHHTSAQDSRLFFAKGGATPLCDPDMDDAPS